MGVMGLLLTTVTTKPSVNTSITIFEQALLIYFTNQEEY